MPAIETMHCHDDALLWEVVGYGADGQPVIESEPTAIKCRWEEEYKEVVDRKGNSVLSVAKVVVKEDIPVGSILFLGTLADYMTTELGLGQGGVLQLSQGGNLLINTAGGGKGTDLHQAVVKTKVADLKGRNNRRWLRLIRWGDTLPAQE